MNYIYCFNNDFQKLIKEQVINMSIGQLALFKAAVIDLKAIGDNNKGSFKTIPKTIDEFINLKNNRSFQSLNLYYVKRYRKLVEKLQDLKESIISLENCKIYDTVLTNTTESVCLTGLNNGLIMFWSFFLLLIGVVGIGFVFWRNELMIKFLKEKKD